LSGTSANPAGNDFTDFYKGALLALENLKASGRSAVVSVYDSGRSATKTEQIVTSAEFIETDLIIGPVYEEEMEPALRFGEFFGVPVVSPLATIRNLDSPVLYQMAPAAESKYDKLLPLLEGDANIILVSSGTNDDPVFESEITTLLADRPYSRFTIGGSREGIASVIDWERENILVVLAGSEGSVDQALATISSSYSNASARRSRRADIRVVGSSRWASYGASIDRNLFFKLGVTFVANYHIDHSDPETRLFESRYLELYGGLPSRSAFRGYDAVALFAGALFEGGHSLHERGSSSFSDRLSFGDRQPDSRLSFDSKLERVGTTPLGAPYRFTRPYGTQKQINNQWTLVTFSSDYNVTTR
jgi:ABC-type branched-subunit amino acid transport system substrate-binding protein